MKRFKNNIFPLVIVAIIIISFLSFFIKGLLPIPSDAMVGLYHPFRDYFAAEYPNGIPFKNFLITDPVRQIYPWKKLAIDLIMNSHLPLWNPYSGTGTPLLANFQSSAFYPLNIIFLSSTFPTSWTFFIFLQPVLSGLFLYIYLKNLNIDSKAAFLGTIAFVFSGFSIVWQEWGTILHTALWLPLILLSIDKMFYFLRNSIVKNQSTKLKLKTSAFAKASADKQNYIFWSIVFILSLISSFFAGHLQIFLYVLIFSTCYFVVRWIQFGIRLKALIIFAICYLIFVLFTSIQWIPTLQFINLSARNLDQMDWNKAGWFIPWQNLLQFIIPDFFGNPSTLNYWGTWNYAELVGYIGLIPLIFAIFATISRFDKKTFFYSVMLLLSLVFSLPTPLAKIPYMLDFPFVSTSQPTRLLFITCFSLAILSSFGFDYFLKKYELKKTCRNISLTIFGFSLLFISIWIFLLSVNNNLNWISAQNLIVSKRNLFFPTLILALFSFMVTAIIFIKNVRFRSFLVLILFVLTTFDLLRFTSKFEPFTNKDYLYPETKTIKFLKNQKTPFRIASNDSRIFPPNLSSYYKIESIDNYDPLYLLSYGELIAASERNKPNISAPFGYNRIITPHNINSKLIDLLNVKYILSLDDINLPKFKKVFTEGSTKIYENLNVLPRVFFVNHIYKANNNQDSIEKMFSNLNFMDDAIVQINEQTNSIPSEFTKGTAKIISYSENKIIIESQNINQGFLVLTDSYYPAWHVKIQNHESLSVSDAQIFRTDYNFRGVIIPKGKNTIEFYAKLF